jgi:hypothetical protein
VYGLVGGLAGVGFAAEEEEEDEEDEDDEDEDEDAVLALAGALRDAIGSLRQGERAMRNDLRELEANNESNSTTASNTWDTDHPRR